MYSFYSEYCIVKNISVIYTADEGSTIAINRQPENYDVTGGNKDVVSILETPIGRVIRISPAEAVGLTTGMSVTCFNANLALHNTLPLAADLNSLVFDATDFGKVVIGMGITGGTVQSNTVVLAKRVVNGAYIVDIDNNVFTNPLDQANFTNCIIYGNDNPEFILDKEEMTPEKIEELDAWERDVIFPLASQRIEIDLDDGVKANYPKFGSALKSIGI